MIILTLLLMAVSLIVFVFMNRQREAVWLSGLFFSFTLCNIGLMFYYSKMGGLTYKEQLLFFLDSRLQKRIQNSMVLLDSIARMLNIGRQLFVYFTLMFSFHISGKVSMRPVITISAALVTLCACLIGDPYFYRLLPRQMQVVSDLCSLVCIIAYSSISMVLLILTYLNFHISWIRQKLRYIIFFVCNLMLYFFFFCQINATSIFYSNHIMLQNLGFKMYSLRLSFTAWIMVIGLFIFFFISGLHSLFLFAKINIDENREDISLERQLSTAGMGIRVFIHGMKNQLMAEQILLTRMRQDDGHQNPSCSTSQYIEELTAINQNMSSRMEVLYKAFKHNSIVLTPQYIGHIIDISLEMLSRKAEACDCQVKLVDDCRILADCSYLSEAVYNILVNAVEAVQISDRANDGRIVIEILENHHWCIIRIADNGIGMGKETLKKIFEPFYTDKNTNYSWGIGLSYVRQTVKYHFGRLHVESREGYGTTFTLAFPVYIPKKGERN